MYYEAILQLRPNKKELLDYALKQIENSNCEIAKQEDLKTGTDLYLSSKKFALSIARRLKKQFKGTILVTKSIYSKDRIKSKDVYRFTICFRLKQ